MRGFLEHRLEATAAGRLKPNWLGVVGHVLFSRLKLENDVWEYLIMSHPLRIGLFGDVAAGARDAVDRGRVRRGMTGSDRFALAVPTALNSTIPANARNFLSGERLRGSPLARHGSAGSLDH